MATIEKTATYAPPGHIDSPVELESRYERAERVRGLGGALRGGRAHGEQERDGYCGRKVRAHGKSLPRRSTFLRAS